MYHNVNRFGKMNFVEFRNWLMEKFKEWERTQPNGRSNYSNFARFLGISVNVYSQWRIGNNLPSYKNAVAIAEKLNDYSIMDILGYERPDVGGSVSLEAFPWRTFNEWSISARRNAIRLPCLY